MHLIISNNSNVRNVRYEVADDSSQKIFCHIVQWKSICNSKSKLCITPMYHIIHYYTIICLANDLSVFHCMVAVVTMPLFSGGAIYLWNTYQCTIFISNTFMSFPTGNKIVSQFLQETNLYAKSSHIKVDRYYLFI